MTSEMYYAGKADLSNEELAIQVRDGDGDAAALLLSQNEGFLSTEAAKLCQQYSLPDIADDLKQEGALALLEAAKRFDPSYGTKLLTYAAPAIGSAMADYCAHSSLLLRIPSGRYHQLRKVAHICAGAEGRPESAFIQAASQALEVSHKVAAELLKEYRTLFHARHLGDDVFSITCGGDPARAYDHHMRRMLLLQLMEEVLKPRELNLVRYYLGIGQPNEEGMTFQELAIRLNYNGPSGAEKAYKNALRKLKKNLYSGAYGQWISIQKAIRSARTEAEVNSDCYISSQTTWLDKKEVSERFIHEVGSLIRVHEVFYDALEIKNG